MSATTGSIPATGSWQIDETHSTASFTLTHNVVATFRGGFHGITGGLENGVLAGSVPVAHLDIPGPDVFKGHLLSEGFFDADGHPTIDFRSEEIHAHDDGTVHASGELTIKGVTKPISIEGSVRGPQEVTLADGSTGERLGIDLTTTVDRRDYGMTIFAGADWIVTLDVALQLSQG
jgi:polyisoprenoid-binding protein YceI